MSSKYPWFRVYSSELLNDRKIKRVSAKAGMHMLMVQGAWQVLMCLAAESPERGRLLISIDMPFEIEEVREQLGIGQEEFERLIGAFEEVGMVAFDGDVLVLPNFETRNPESDSSTIRTREYRKRKRGSDELHPAK